jgi:uncharacterized protein
VPLCYAETAELAEGNPRIGCSPAPVLYQEHQVMQHPTVSVADILGKPGEYRDLDVKATLPDVRTALARLDGSVSARLRIESVVEGVLVTGTVEAAASFECARCLAETRAPTTVEVCELFVTAERRAADEDAYSVSGTEVELEPMLRDALALGLPLKPLCRDDCRGLCARCGQNLNGAQCGCVDDTVDPRWAALSTLRAGLES